MAGYFRMEVKVVSRTAIRSNGAVGKNSALNAAAYITAEKYQEQKQTAINAAAYISGGQIQSDTDEVKADYRSKKGVLDSWVVLPEHAPKRLLDPQILWNEVEAIEKECNADLYREWIISFEKHLTDEQRKLVAQEFAETLVAEGMAVHVAIHDQKDNNGNFHMHILAPTRGFNEDGTWQKYKTYYRGYAKDANGQRIPVIDKKTGQQKVDAHGRKQWKRERIRYVNAWNDKRLDNVTRWRETFANIENQYLPKEYQVSPYSYAKQAIDKIPGKHLGKAASNVQKRLQEQVAGLSMEQRQEYLQRILEQVQKDYRAAYYENSRLCSAERKMVSEYTEERQMLKAEIVSELQKVKKYTPQKQYVTSYKKNMLQIEIALVKLMEFYQYASQQTNQNDVEFTLKMMEKLVQIENDLIIVFSYGTTAALENHLSVGTYDMETELLKQLGAEIKETEAEIMQLKEEEQTDEIQRKLEQYRERIQRIRDRQSVNANGGAGWANPGTAGPDCTTKDETLEYAERISKLSAELEASVTRMGKASVAVAESAKRIFEHRERDEAKRNYQIKKALGRTEKRK